MTYMTTPEPGSTAARAATTAAAGPSTPAARQATPDLAGVPSASLWIWPPIGLAVVAASGAAFGPLGTVVAAVIGAPMMVLYLARSLIMPHWPAVALAVIPTLIAASLIAAAESGSTLLARNGRPGRTSSTATVDASPRLVMPRDVGNRSLRGAHFEGGIFKVTDLTRRDMSSAFLNGASLKGVVLRDADLRDAHLRGADLRFADLRGACLDRADLSGALLDHTIIDGAFMSGVMVSSPEALEQLGWPLGDKARPCPR